jgi:SIR2-like domain
MREPLDSHCLKVVRAMERGQVVPLLGAGANLCDRPADCAWDAELHPPSGAELARVLADEFGYPLDDRTELARVSEYVDLAAGEGPLYERLRDIFDAEYPPNSLHRFLAALPGALEAKGKGHRHQLVITTNYDDILERAFSDAGEPYEVVVYMAGGPDRGRFVHYLADGERRLIERPNEYTELSFDTGSVILKIHGAIDRGDEARDSFVVSEDHYIEYLTHANLSQLVPVSVLARLRRSHFLFLGYRMRDWNLRVMLHRIFRERDHGYRSWAVQLDPDLVDEELWSRREVDVVDVALSEYVEELTRQLEAAAPQVSA